MHQLPEAIGEVKGTTGNAGVAVYPRGATKQLVDLPSTTRVCKKGLLQVSLFQPLLECLLVEAGHYADI